MRYCLTGLLTALVVVTAGEVVLGQLRGGAGTPRGDERRSMGNLRPRSTQPAPGRSMSQPPRQSSGVLNHRPYSYGNPPYYRRPPVTPYVVPYYVNPYYADPYPYYANPYYGRSPYGGYYVQPYGMGPLVQPVRPHVHRRVPRRNPRF